MDNGESKLGDLRKQSVRDSICSTATVKMNHAVVGLKYIMDTSSERYIKLVRMQTEGLKSIKAIAEPYYGDSKGPIVVSFLAIISLCGFYREALQQVAVTSFDELENVKGTKAVTWDIQFNLNLTGVELRSAMEIEMVSWVIKYNALSLLLLYKQPNLYKQVPEAESYNITKYFIEINEVILLMLNNIKIGAYQRILNSSVIDQSLKPIVSSYMAKLCLMELPISLNKPGEDKRYIKMLIESSVVYLAYTSKYLGEVRKLYDKELWDGINSEKAELNSNLLKYIAMSGMQMTEVLKDQPDYVKKYYELIQMMVPKSDGSLDAPPGMSL